MSDWGKLQERYADNSVPRKMLSCDGGGIFGVISLEILLEMETKLKVKLGRGDDFRLCHYFDYIAGNSTGAIIAAGLAIGMSVKELLDFYDKYGADMFETSRFFARLRTLYGSEELSDMLKGIFKKENGDLIRLFPDDLECLLLVITKNETTDSAWPISSNPDAKYNQINRLDCNLKIPLWQLVRASTAAPVFFPPEVMQWDKSDPKKTFVFVDGGLTPFNNPAHQLFRMATLPEYKLEWETGEDKLLLVSVGTGSKAAVGPSGENAHLNMLATAKRVPSGLMNAAAFDQDVNCRSYGRCVFGPQIDRELGDMVPLDDRGNRIPLSQDLGRKFLYVRYDPDTSVDRLVEMGFDENVAKGMQSMDSVKYIKELRQVGCRHAENVSLDHFGPFLP